MSSRLEMCYLATIFFISSLGSYTGGIDPNDGYRFLCQTMIVIVCWVFGARAAQIGKWMAFGVAIFHIFAFFAVLLRAIGGGSFETVVRQKILIHQLKPIVWSLSNLSLFGIVSRELNRRD